MRADIAAFIRSLPAEWGYAQIAEACRVEFGDDAPDEAEIRAWWIRHGKPADPRRRVPKDREVEAAIRDLVGRMSPAAILRELAKRYGAERVPPRSTLYRFVSGVLAEEVSESR